MESVGSFIAYVIIALVIVIFSVMAVTTRKILRAATYLLFVLFATAAIYFQLDYEFLGAVQIAVYAGGIVVLFVFAILLTSHPGNNEKQLESRKRVRAMLLGVAMFVIGGISLVSRADSLLSRPDMPLLDMKALGTALMGTGHGQYLLPFEAVSILLLGCMIGGIVVARKK